MLHAGWLNRVARNLAVQKHRRDVLGRRHDQRSASERIGPSPAETVERLESQQLVVEVVLGLGEPYRETVLLRFFHDLTPAEIAARQGIPPATVRSRIARALALLRTRLEERQGGDPGSWRALLTPIIQAPPAGPVALTILGEVLIMSVTMKAAAGLAAALLITWGVISMRGDPVTSEPVAPAHPSVAALGPPPESVEEIPPSREAQSSEPSTQVAVATPEKNFRVLGRVIDAASGRPLPGVAAWVQLMDTWDGELPESHVVTDDQGSRDREGTTDLQPVDRELARSRRVEARPRRGWTELSARTCGGGRRDRADSGD